MSEITGSTNGVEGSNICNVSPSDQAATLDNILSRLQRLETLFSQYLGSNVQVEQLSDISQNLGWITDVTYLGQEGFTQTPAGTLIPPAGWTGLSHIISGQNGTVIYAGGTQVTGGGGGGAMDYCSATYCYSSGIKVFSEELESGITFTSIDDYRAYNFTAQVSQDGLYIAHVFNGGGDGVYLSNKTYVSRATIRTSVDAAAYDNQEGGMGLAGLYGGEHISGQRTRIFRLSANDTITGQAATLEGSTYFDHLAGFEFSVVRLSE